MSANDPTSDMTSPVSRDARHSTFATWRERRPTVEAHAPRQGWLPERVAWAAGLQPRMPFIDNRRSMGGRAHGGSILTDGPPQGFTAPGIETLPIRKCPRYP